MGNARFSLLGLLLVIAVVTSGCIGVPSATESPDTSTTTPPITTSPMTTTDTWDTIADSQVQDAYESHSEAPVIIWVADADDIDTLVQQLEANGITDYQRLESVPAVAATISESDARAIAAEDYVVRLQYDHTVSAT